MVCLLKALPDKLFPVQKRAVAALFHSNENKLNLLADSRERHTFFTRNFLCAWDEPS